MSTVITSSTTPCPGKVSKPIYTDHDLYTIPKLTYDNVNYWKLAMFNYIQGNGLFGFIDVQMIPPPKIIEDVQQSTWIENPIYKCWEEIDNELKMSIISTIHDELLATIPSSFTEPKGSVESTIHDELLETLPRSFTNPLAATDRSHDQHGEIPGSFKRKSSADLWTYIDKNIHRRPKMTHPDRVGDGQKITQHLPLYKAAVEGDVKSLHEILEKEPTVVRDIITGASETALIIASHKENNNEFVAELVKLLSRDDLAMQNSFGRTAMFGAAATGNVKTLEIMVEKNNDLPNIRDMYNLLPLHFAAYAGQKHSVHYLLKVTKLTYEEVTERLEGSSLITALISGGFYDICLNMLKECPQLAVAEVSPLETLTNKNSAFLSGAHFSF
ncbi:putative ankyrin repeat-containing domain, PGG domain, ankyrin repeat-containing domain superfamily protein, partial [Tanacetum coccineum]